MSCFRQSVNDWFWRKADSAGEGVRSTRAIQKLDDKRQRPRLGFPFPAFPPTERSFANTRDFSRTLYRQAMPPTLGQQFLSERDRFWPWLIAQILDDRRVLVDVGFSLIALPPHPGLRVDAEDGRRIDLAMSEHLPPKLELAPKACSRFKYRFLASRGQRSGNAR